MYWALLLGRELWDKDLGWGPWRRGPRRKVLSYRSALRCTHFGSVPSRWSDLSGLGRLLAKVEQQIWTELLQKIGQAPQRINDQSSEARSRQMCFYRPLNETNEWWGPWPLREAEGGGCGEAAAKS